MLLSDYGLELYSPVHSPTNLNRVTDLSIFKPHSRLIDLSIPNKYMKPAAFFYDRCRDLKLLRRSQSFFAPNRNF
jgi:hypothetical protein